MGITFLQQREAFCCKKSQSLYKTILPSLPLPQVLAGPAFTAHPAAPMKPSAHLRGLPVVRAGPSTHPPCGPASSTHRSLTCNHQGEVETFLHGFPVDLVGQSGKAHVLLLMVLRGRGGQEVRVCHHSCLSIAKQHGAGFKGLKKPRGRAKGWRKDGSVSQQQRGAQGLGSGTPDLPAGACWHREPPLCNHCPARLLSAAHRPGTVTAPQVFQSHSGTSPSRGVWHAAEGSV